MICLQTKFVEMDTPLNVNGSLVVNVRIRLPSKCIWCGNVFNDRQKLTSHKDICRKVTNRGQFCEKGDNKDTCSRQLRFNGKDTLSVKVNNDDTLPKENSNNKIYFGQLETYEDCLREIDSSEDCSEQIKHNGGLERPRETKEELLGTINNDKSECVICRKKYKTIGSLRCHLRYEHLPIPRKYNCRYCGVPFTRPWSRKRHETKQHKTKLYSISH